MWSGVVLYENGLSPEHVEVITLERSCATQQQASPASANVYHSVCAQQKQLQKAVNNNNSSYAASQPPTWQPDAISRIGFITASDIFVCLLVCLFIAFQSSAFLDLQKRS